MYIFINFLMKLYSFMTRTNMNDMKKRDTLNELHRQWEELVSPANQGEGGKKVSSKRPNPTPYSAQIV
jgi:predicted alternative tryptophan synthase beta-subunit